MMADKSKLSITQRAITSPTGLSRTKELPFKASEAAAPKQTAPPLPEDLETATEKKLFPPNELYITMKLPQEVAILHIYQNGTDEYSVWGGNVENELQQTKPNKKPDLCLGQLMEKDKLPEDVQVDIRYFSHVNLEIRKWLKTLRRRLGKQLCLVIADHTDFEIPWEMFELSPYESPNEYLGALITTVRWRQIISGDDYVVLEFKADECCGNAVAYVLDTELNGVGPELDILEQLQASIYRSSKHNIKLFQAHLQRNDANCGFVYISCHGTYGSDFRKFTLGSGKDEQQQLKLLALRNCQLNLVKNSQGIVFINACHSGREQAHSSIPHSYRMGFIELFLASGARGVIGTLGTVGDSYAAKFAYDLIQESLRSPNLSVAALLQELRFKMVANFPDKPTNEEWESFIYTFMYVYYGNPMTVLRLTPSGGQLNV
ncbi:CHAT domain-containing protein [Microcoleus sp. FACHB-672]|uniref:CHAT domain-containing protein n=1 Tax=Microcoleus sp. FACHB-672 TaxID=2692825 RepID=UPI0016892AF0|nr:CHAT domain-containing protein [Microcoleus sp. FACHB-672]MBD2039250.1 CHAT domain-containing protein [Microcoleus sp. FACHB-672]